MNVVIVESKNDKLFIQALIATLNIENTEVEKIAIADDNFWLLDGLDPNPRKPTHLIRKLKDIRTDIPKKGIEKIGILLDIDNAKIKDRFTLVNTAIAKAFDKDSFEGFSSVNQSIELQLDDDTVEFFCYFTNVDEHGDLETVLRTIATKDALYANCLQNWQKCLEEEGAGLTDKEFDKLWIDNYLRFDTCTKTERVQAARKCSMRAFDYVMQHKRDVFDFSHEVLAGLKEFLSRFRKIS